MLGTYAHCTLVLQAAFLGELFQDRPMGVYKNRHWMG
jgi:hypothetical protein